jgi:hypothetical protein
VPYKKEAEPWATARWLVRFRNLIAHAKPEFLREEILMTRDQHDSRLFDPPKSKLEKEITLGNAKRALDAAEALRIGC